MIVPWMPVHLSASDVALFMDIREEAVGKQTAFPL
jgi:hypothetical protein